MRGLGAGTFVLFAVVTLAAEGSVSPEEAIARAVEQRLGIPVSVVVTDLATTVESEVTLVAAPEVTARLGQRSRFVLSAGGTRRGTALAHVTATGVYPRAARSIARDEVIDVSAVDLSEGELPALPLRPLLTAETLRGLKARRNIVAGEPLTNAVLWVPPLVRSGDTVDVTVRIGAVSVTGSAIASGSGQVGEVIRIKQPHSSRLLTARIVRAGAVEIVK